MEKVCWKHSKAYHTISFSLSPEGRFLISEWKTGSRESQRKACGCHPEGAPWPTTAAALWPTPALAPGLPSAPGPGWGRGCLAWSNQEDFVLPWFRNTQTKVVLLALGHVAGGAPHGFCKLWWAVPFQHMSYGGLQLPLTGEAPILQIHSFQFIPKLACSDDHLLL